MADIMNISEYLAQHANQRRKPRQEEHLLQRDCVRLFRMLYPQYRSRLFAVPNGGRRDATTAKKLKDEGVIAGVSDLIFLKRTPRYGALLIEMKTSKGIQSKEQDAWEQSVTQDGEYKYVICRSLAQFKEIIENYLNNL